MRKNETRPAYSSLFPKRKPRRTINRIPEFLMQTAVEGEDLDKQDGRQLIDRIHS